MTTPPVDQSEQTQLAEPIKVRFTGKLRTRIQERHGEYTRNEDNPSYDGMTISVHRTLSRQKTNVVCETIEEAEAFIHTMEHYAMPGVHWMNGPMVKTARRVKREVREALDKRT